MKKNQHKTAYRLLLIAEVLVKIDILSIAGYALKFIGYAIIVCADANISVKQIMVALVVVVTIVQSSSTTTADNQPIPHLEFAVLPNGTRQNYVMSHNDRYPAI